MNAYPHLSNLHPQHSPVAASTAYLLVMGGLIPFVSLAVASVLMDGAHAPLLHHPLVTYGAVILSFVGALHWGIAISHPSGSRSDRSVLLCWSVVPALLGWFALMLPMGIDLGVLVLAFCLHLFFDLRAMRRHVLPAWYRPARILATTVASLCLLAPLVFGQTLSLSTDPHALWKGIQGIESPERCPAGGSGAVGTGIQKEEGHAPRWAVRA